MKAITVEGFEQKFRANIDPWDYKQSRFEHRKREVLLQACSHRKHGRALELGCAIGETTRLLAPLCLQLTAVDGSATALAEARRRLPRWAHVRFVHAQLPQAMPKGPFDLIVVSELAYYLPVHQLLLLCEKLSAAVARRGTIVALHHRQPFDDAAQLPTRAHERLRTYFRKRLSMVFEQVHPKFNVVAFKKFDR
jgi:trans-aconitate methyltransferase